MGPIQLRQIKITNNTCHTANSLRNFIEDCYNYDVTYGTQDTSSFGPDNMYNIRFPNSRIVAINGVTLEMSTGLDQTLTTLKVDISWNFQTLRLVQG